MSCEVFNRVAAITVLAVHWLLYRKGTDIAQIGFLCFLETLIFNDRNGDEITFWNDQYTWHPAWGRVFSYLALNKTWFSEYFDLNRVLNPTLERLTKFVCQEVDHSKSRTGSVFLKVFNTIQGFLVKILSTRSCPNKWPSKWPCSPPPPPPETMNNCIPKPDFSTLLRMDNTRIIFTYNVRKTFSLCQLSSFT